MTTQSDGSVTVGNDDVISLAMRMAPDKPIFNEDGSFTTNDAIGDELDNPYAVATERALLVVAWIVTSLPSRMDEKPERTSMIVSGRSR